MKCPNCGANIEVNADVDGYILVRQDCLCDIDVKALLKSGEEKR